MWPVSGRKKGKNYANPANRRFAHPASRRLAKTLKSKRLAAQGVCFLKFFVYLCGAVHDAEPRQRGMRVGLFGSPRSRGGLLTY